jgi:murein DD-endopeptidase MepM/ murein hydrolase activator NlpD
MTYPTIVAHEPRFGGTVSLGSLRCSFASHNSRFRAPDETAIQAACFDWPRLDPAAAFGHLTVHLAQNVLIGADGFAHPALFGANTVAIGACPFSPASTLDWPVYFAFLLGHEYGHAFAGRWLRGAPATRYYAVRGGDAETTADDVRTLLGGPLVSAHEVPGAPLMGEVRMMALAALLDAVAAIPKSKEVLPMIEGLKLLRPVGKEFRVTAPFGEKNAALWGEAGHTGTDFGCPVGTPVRAAKSGKVAFVGRSERSGLYVSLEHGVIGCEKVFTIYCHLDETRMAWGLRVEQGEVIGYSGASGERKDGKPMPPHLHFTFHDGGVAADPAPYFAEGPFPDVMPEHWAEEFIRAASELGIVTGDPSGAFRPEESLTRAEMTAVAMRLLEVVGEDVGLRVEGLKAWAEGTFAKAGGAK